MTGRFWLATGLAGCLSFMTASAYADKSKGFFQESFGNYQEVVKRHTQNIYIQSYQKLYEHR
jgi:hypothetical protein